SQSHQLICTHPDPLTSDFCWIALAFRRDPAGQTPKVRDRGAAGERFQARCATGKEEAGSRSRNLENSSGTFRPAHRSCIAGRFCGGPIPND
ncbi:hypothetical protein BaRGS_00020208, partial [Batillaria attramentaria]